MKLTGPEGDFELTILDYEYSDSPTFLTRNWLLVNLRTRVDGYETTLTAPLLSTWEIELLLDWMRSVADGHELSPKLTFVEPALGFRNLSTTLGDYRLGINLAHEAAGLNRRNPQKPGTIPVTVSRDQLQTAIQDLERQLKAFPVRT